MHPPESTPKSLYVQNTTSDIICLSSPPLFVYPPPTHTHTGSILSIYGRAPALPARLQEMRGRPPHARLAQL